MPAVIARVLAPILFGLTGIAHAQCLTTLPGSPGTTVDSFCNSTARFETVLPTVADARIDIYTTHLIGRLAGNPNLFYDQTFSVPVGDAAFMAGVLSAQQVLQGQSSDPLSFAGPTLVQSTTALVGSELSTRQVGAPTQTFPTIVIFGPDEMRIGDYGTCTRYDTSFQPPVPAGCSLGGVRYVVEAGTTLYNLFTITTFTFERVSTDTWLTTAEYEIVGQPQPGGVVSSPATIALLGLGLLGMRIGTGTRRRVGAAC